MDFLNSLSVEILESVCAFVDLLQSMAFHCFNI